MVQFGLKLEDNRVDKWSSQYVDYKKLKKAIKQLAFTRKAAGIIAQRCVRRCLFADHRRTILPCCALACVSICPTIAVVITRACMQFGVLIMHHERREPVFCGMTRFPGKTGCSMCRKRMVETLARCFPRPLPRQGRAPDEFLPVRRKRSHSKTRVLCGDVVEYCRCVYHRKGFE